MSHVQIDFIKEYFPDFVLPITFVFYQNIDSECSIRTLQRNKPSLVHIKAIFPKRTNLLHKLDVDKDTIVLSSFVLILLGTYNSDCGTLSLVSFKCLRFSLSCSTEATSQQRCIIKIYNRPRDRPYIQRCSANGGRHCRVDFHIDFFVL